MKIRYDDIENAFMFVSMEQMFGNQALLSKKTGEIFYISDYGDSDELPDDIEDSDNYIEIPHKNDLDLGKQLVNQFVSEHLPEEVAHVSQIFRRKGAYSKYKALLEKKGLLDKWCNFEQRKQNEGLRKWCSDNDIEIFE
jgi:hypothetical protein